MKPLPPSILTNESLRKTSTENIYPVDVLPLPKSLVENLKTQINSNNPVGERSRTNLSKLSFYLKHYDIETAEKLSSVESRICNPRLSSLIKFQSMENSTFEKEYASITSDLMEYIGRMKNEIVNNFSDNNEMIVLHVSPAERYIINAYAENETKRKNKPISPELLIKGSFFHIIKNGPFDTFSCLFSNSQLSQIINKFKTNG